MKIRNKIIKLGIYADDVACYLTYPEISFKALWQVLEVFGSSGYKINPDKTIDGTLFIGKRQSEDIGNNAM